MQAASAEAPFSSPEYVFEVKWDGLRCIMRGAADAGRFGRGTVQLP
jgi:ATP-dependent DNA ligase